MKHLIFTNLPSKLPNFKRRLYTTNNFYKNQVKSLNLPSEEDSSPSLLLIEGDVKLNTPNGSSLSPFFVDTWKED